MTTKSQMYLNGNKSTSAVYSISNGSVGYSDGIKSGEDFLNTFYHNFHDFY